MRVNLFSCYIERGQIIQLFISERQTDILLMLGIASIAEKESIVSVCGLNMLSLSQPSLSTFSGRQTYCKVSAVFTGIVIGINFNLNRIVELSNLLRPTSPVFTLV